MYFWGVKFSVIPWAVTTKSPPSAGHEMLQLAYPAAAVTAPSGASPEPASHVTVLSELVQPAAQPKPTQVPAGSATSQPRAAHAVASLDAHESPGCVGRGQRCA